MKKYFLFLLIALFAVSCSKKIEVKGKIVGGSPLDRVEFIEGSGVATLPLLNLALKNDGSFSGNFDAPKDGMYVINYGGKQALVYLEKGQTLDIAANANTFPNDMKISGDAFKNYDFMKQSNKFLENYAGKLQFQTIFAKDEAAFLKDADKIKDDLQKNIDETATKTGASAGAKSWKEMELNTSILMMLQQYQTAHPQLTANPSFKVSPKFVEKQKELSKDADKMVETLPIYRNYLLNSLSQDYAKYSQAHQNSTITGTENFLNFLKTRKDLSATAKDYLLAFVMAQSDITPETTPEIRTKIAKIIDTDIQNQTIKDDLKKLQFVISGFPIGTALPAAKLQKTDGKDFDIASLKGKPTVVMMYASWNPYISQATIPVISEVANFYKSKANFLYINMDDTKDQFVKTSAEMMKGIAGTNVFAEGGLNSQFAKDFGIYGFRLPSFFILDKDGKVASRNFFNLGDPQFVEVMEKQTGLKAPAVAPQAQLQVDPNAAAPAPQPAPAPAEKPAPAPEMK